MRNELNQNLIPKDKMSWDVMTCYCCLAIMGAGTYVLSFFAGYHLKETEDDNTTFTNFTTFYNLLE